MKIENICCRPRPLLASTLAKAQNVLQGEENAHRLFKGKLIIIAMLSVVYISQVKESSSIHASIHQHLHHHFTATPGRTLQYLGD